MINKKWLKTHKVIKMYFMDLTAYFFDASL